MHAIQTGPGGGIGRRDGFKIRFWQQSAGSSPARGTKLDSQFCNWLKTLKSSDVLVVL